MAEFAIRSLAAMAENNPVYKMKGGRPVLGSHLEVKWYFLLPILGSIALVHLLLATAAIWFTRGVEIPVEGHEGECIVLRRLTSTTDAHELGD
jgi:hypothetical protein